MPSANANALPLPPSASAVPTRLSAAIFRAKVLAHRAFRAVRNLIDETPRPGARGHQVAFLHPASTGGVLFELCAGSEA